MPEANALGCPNSYPEEEGESKAGEGEIGALFYLFSSRMLSQANFK
jgi:hypothetical protein